MDVTPQELRGSEIKEAWRGYHRDEVDELLERAAVTIENLGQQLATAGSRPATAPDAPPSITRDDAEVLQRTLLLAQRAADDAVNEAQAQARQLLEESEARAQALVGEAEASARRIAESERRRLESEIEDLAIRRDALKADADALERYARSYREHVRAAIESDLDRLGTGVIEPPTPRPEMTADAATAAATPEPDRLPPPEPLREDRGARDDGGERDDRGGGGSETQTITVDAPRGSGDLRHEAAPSSVAAPPRPAEADWPPTPQASALAAQPAPGWLPGYDDRAGETPAWDEPTGVHEPFASETPMEATPVDTDSLDDDAFFASLRDAVRDDESFGSREEEPIPFFDDEIADDRRRFRRRR